MIPLTPETTAVLVGGAVVAIVLFLFSIALLLRAPPEYGPDEIARDPDDPTVTTIVRAALVTTPFFENGERVARAETFGLGVTGIMLRLEGDRREILFTTEGDWFAETRFKLRSDLRLHLVIDGKPTVTAARVSDPAFFGRPTYFDIDTPQGRFELAPRGHPKFDLLRGDTVIGIVAMPELSGNGGRFHSRIELPGSLPLETRLFLALLVKLECKDD